MRLGVKGVVSLAALAVVGALPLMAQLEADELRKDQVFEAIMVSVRNDQPQASGYARIILPSPRFFPLNRFVYVRVEAEGLVPGKSHNIHLHTTGTDSGGATTAGCAAGGGVVVNLKGLVADANGKGVSVTRVILDENNAIVADAIGRSNAARVTRATLTNWYVQYHVPAGETGAGGAMACGEITLGGFDRGTAFR
jgi:hypothetical protein